MKLVTFEITPGQRVLRRVVALAEAEQIHGDHQQQGGLTDQANHRTQASSNVTGSRQAAGGGDAGPRSATDRRVSGADRPVDAAPAG